MIDETVEEIREMQTHSSSVVAVKAARALEELCSREFTSVEDFERDLERNSSALRRANPSHASLVTTQRAIVSMVGDEGAGTVEEAKERLRDAVEDVVEQVETAKRRAAGNALEYIEDGMTVLTHDYSSTVLEAIERAVADGAYLDVYVTEARPRYLGRKTARVLAEYDRVNAHLIVDGACGHYLPDCDRVFLGMDCIVEDTLYNRVGTFPLAATASEVGTPVTVVGSSAKLVGEGFRFENDFRSPSEVLLEPAEGFAVENPAYDATPTDLLDNVVTDEGVREL
ncbi:translation initiation factor eIF-2B [Halorussus salilacus]|uniref:translation initiation factor eIF-2B n=1 Tax=Halorussus salilacus TaxID=2953750 RepID=UPI0020A21D17|nr:translation initiation factor eIF-2B [Halorussus salilacus]USZ67763.1 translation initiation factor eIF-2B [Halorussus salilacus]